MQIISLLCSQTSYFRKLWAVQETLLKIQILHRAEITSILPRRFITLSKCPAQKIVQNFHQLQHDFLSNFCFIFFENLREDQERKTKMVCSNTTIYQEYS